MFRTSVTLPETFLKGGRSLKIYTIKDIAKIAGVGVSTVSRVLNDKPDVKLETKLKVLEVIKQYNYSQNNNARILKQRTTKTIAVVVRGKKSAFLNSIIEKMYCFVKKTEFNFIFEYIDEQENEFIIAKQLLKDKKIEGIIFLGGNACDNYSEIKHLKIPCIYSTVDASNIDLKLVSSVAIDDVKAGKLAIDYLASKGHKKIAVISSKPDKMDSIGLRFKGVLDGIKENSLEFSNDYFINSSFLFESAYEGVMKKKEILKKVTAIFAMSDIMAIGAAKAITDCGYRIPEDISLLGFDGIELGRYYNPTITTIKQPEEKLAQKSIQLIIDSIAEGKQGKHIILDAFLVEGSSVREI